MHDYFAGNILNYDWFTTTFIEVCRILFNWQSWFQLIIKIFPNLIAGRLGIRIGK